MLSGTEILTTAQMRAIESAAMVAGAATGAQLMERAGAAVAGQIRLRWPRPGRATVLCGPGNNGGDGYVIARILARAGWRVRVLGLENMPGADAAGMKRLWRDMGPIGPLTEAGLRHDADSDVYLDAIFGTGLTRPPEAGIAGLLACLGGSGGDGRSFRDRLVAVDCPSGLCLDSGVVLGSPRAGGPHDPHACLTVAFDSPKPGHLLERGPVLCGRLVVADIGLAPWRERETATGPDGMTIVVQRRARLTALWPEFPIRDSRHTAMQPPARLLARDSASQPHKFSHGHALILAGGSARGGAARLSARAALRVGAGLVTLCPPEAALPEHAGPPDALMRHPIDSAAELRLALDDARITAVCLGPGGGVARCAGLLPALLASRRACVLDADALTAIAQGADLARGLHEGCVLTPHGGEFARLFPDLAERLRWPAPPGPVFSRVDAARAAAARSGAVVLLKGPDTVIAAPDGQARIHSAFDIPWLATAGSGDVLSGLVTGLLARGLPPLIAAGLGVMLHAGAARRFGPGLIADDLPDQIPGLLRTLAGPPAPGP